MKKLSQAQERAYNEIIENLNFIKRDETIEEFYERIEKRFRWRENGKENKEYNELTNDEKHEVNEKYERAQNNVVLVYRVNTRTLKTLENMGLIEIIFSNGLVDEVKVL